MNYSIKQISSSFLLAIASLCIGILLGSYFFQKDVTISYISQSELLELEKQRLAKEGAASRQLFYGYPKEAIKLIEALQVSKSKGSKLVLLTDKAIYGKNITSISHEVHTEVLKLLALDTTSKLQIKNTNTKTLTQK
jgi:hypothetical protein